MILQYFVQNLFPIFVSWQKISRFTDAPVYRCSPSFEYIIWRRFNSYLTRKCQNCLYNKLFLQKSSGANGLKNWPSTTSDVNWLYELANDNGLTNYIVINPKLLIMQFSRDSSIEWITLPTGNYPNLGFYCRLNSCNFVTELKSLFIWRRCYNFKCHYDEILIFPFVAVLKY